MPKVYLMRGLPGSGKTKYAKEHFLPLLDKPLHLIDYYFSTDLYWKTETNDYDYRPAEISKAHAWNFKRFDSALADSHPDIVVDNTNISAYELAPYILAASAYGFEHEIITVWADPIVCIKRNTHNVPANVIMGMYQRLLTETLPPFWKHTVIYPET